VVVPNADLKAYVFASRSALLSFSVIALALPTHLAERNKAILRRVMIINMQIPSRPQMQTPASMLRKRMQHMVQEPNARVYANLLALGVLTRMTLAVAIFAFELW